MTLNSHPLSLTHWGLVTYICVSKVGHQWLDNSFAPAQCQAIIWTNDDFLLIQSLGTNFDEILIEIQLFLFWKMHLKMSSAKWQPFYLILNVLTFLVLWAEYPGDSGQSWWRYQMETFSALLALCAGNSPVTCEFPSQRPVMRSFDVSLICALNRRLSKHLWGWWFETPSRPLSHHCNDHNGWCLGVISSCDKTSYHFCLESLITLKFDKCPSSTKTTVKF